MIRNNELEELCGGFRIFIKHYLDEEKARHILTLFDKGYLTTHDALKAFLDLYEDQENGR
jgi:hypothetical protein